MNKIQLYFYLQEVDTGSTVNTGDELDEYLDNLDAEKNEALGDYQ